MTRELKLEAQIALSKLSISDLEYLLLFAGVAVPVQLKGTAPYHIELVDRLIVVIENR